LILQNKFKVLASKVIKYRIREEIVRRQEIVEEIVRRQEIVEEKVRCFKYWGIEHYKWECSNIEVKGSDICRV